MSIVVALIRHSRLPAGNMPYGFVRIFFFFLFFFFFRRQGFRMITFDRQAGPLQNFNRSHVMAIGRSVLFSDPARPPGFCLHAFQSPRNIFEKKILVGKKNFFWRFKTPGTFLREKKISVQYSTSPPPPPPARPRPVLRTLTPILVQ